MDTPQVLLDHHLKTLRLPTFLREYDKVAQQCAAEGVDFPRYLLRLSELELLDRDRRATERRIRQAKFDVVKSLDSFDFLAIPSLNKALVLDLARCEFIERKENVLALGNSGTGKTHIALALGLAACQKGFRVRFTTAASLAHELIEAKDERRLMRFQKMLSSFELLIIDELGFVPLSKTGAELLFEVFSRRYERSATLVELLNDQRCFFEDLSSSISECEESFECLARRFTHGNRPQEDVEKVVKKTSKVDEEGH